MKMYTHQLALCRSMICVLHHMRDVEARPWWLERGVSYPCAPSTSLLSRDDRIGERGANRSDSISGYEP